MVELRRADGDATGAGDREPRRGVQVTRSRVRPLEEIRARDPSTDESRDDPPEIGRVGINLPERRALVDHPVHPRLEGILRGVQVDDPFLAIVADAEPLEDDALAFLAEMETEAGNLEGTLVLQGPRLEGDVQMLPVRLHVVSEGFPEAGQESRCGSGDIGFGHADEGGPGSPLNPRNRNPSVVRGTNLLCADESA